MKTIWAIIQTGIAGIGGVVGWYLGGFDGFLFALVAFASADYCTGLLRSVVEKNLSSRIGAHGIAKKVAMFIVVGLGHLVDFYVLEGTGAPLRTAVIFFYLANEGVSMLENATAIGLPVPEKLKEVLVQLHGKATEPERGEMVAPPQPQPGVGVENEKPDNSGIQTKEDDGHES
jgi:toxin secretion/phage lysis holin